MLFRHILICYYFAEVKADTPPPTQAEEPGKFLWRSRPTTCINVDNLTKSSKQFVAKYLRVFGGRFTKKNI